jgi:transcriptional regulator with XRE-family HTH domain
MVNMGMTADYIELLRRHQADEGWSDRRMAAEIGVSSTYWHYLSEGRREPGVGFLRKAMQRFPEYNLAAMSYLLEPGAPLAASR